MSEVPLHLLGTRKTFISRHDQASRHGATLNKFTLAWFSLNHETGLKRPVSVTPITHPRYRGLSLIRTPPPEGPCSSPMPRDLW